MAATSSQEKIDCPSINRTTYRAMRDVLKRCVGFSFPESQVAAQNELGEIYKAVVFEQVCRTLLRLGYLRVMGTNVDYAQRQATTYCWSVSPSSALHTELLIILEINHGLKAHADSTLHLDAALALTPQ